MLTLYRLIPVLFAETLEDADLPPQPKYRQLRAAIGHHFDEPVEHVSVLWAFDPGEPPKYLDMFVGETSAINGRHIRNIRASEIYRNNTLTQNPGRDPESLPAISGPALLFRRRVWF